MNTKFEITGDYIELIKLLKATGVADTGGQAKIMVENSLVKVDGEIELRKRRKVKPGMKVSVKNQEIEVV